MDVLSKTVFYSILMLLSAACSDAQPVRVQESYGGLWGYLDQDLNMTISPQYTSATDFDDGVAVVRIESGEFRIISETGNAIAEIEAERAYTPSDGMIRADLGNGWGYYDYQGELQLSGYSSAGDFSEGKAFVEVDDVSTYIDKSGQMLFSELTIDWGYPFQDGIARVRQQMDWTTQLYGYIDATGAFVVEPEYYDLGPFSDGLAAAGFTPQENTSEAERYGYIDRDGDVVIEPSYYDALPFFSGLALVQYEKNDGLGALPTHYQTIDKQGNTVTELDRALQVYSAQDEHIVIGRLTDSGDDIVLGFMDRNGNITIEPAFDSDTYHFSSGYWQMFHNRTMQPFLINPADRMVIPLDSVLDSTD